MFESGVREQSQPPKQKQDAWLLAWVCAVNDSQRWTAKPTPLWSTGRKSDTSKRGLFKKGKLPSLT